MADYYNPNSNIRNAIGLLTGINNPWVVGSSEAPRVHGMNTIGFHDRVPRLKNQFFVHFQFGIPITFGSESNEIKGITYRVKAFDAPKFSIEIETLNQYNKRRIVPTKINFDPCNISFHDDKSSQVQDFWRLVYEFYFKDGINKSAENYSFNASTKIVEGLGKGAIKNDLSDYGYSLVGKKENHNLFKYISLYLVANRKYSRIDLINPYLTNFAHDNFGIDGHGEHSSLSTTFNSETVVYVNENANIQDEPILNGLMGLSNRDNSIFNHWAGSDSILPPIAQQVIGATRRVLAVREFLTADRGRQIERLTDVFDRVLASSSRGPISNISIGELLPDDLNIVKSFNDLNSFLPTSVNRESSVFDRIKNTADSGRRLIGPNFNNNVVAINRDIEKPWTNFNIKGNKTVNQSFSDINNSFNEVFGAARLAQNISISPW